MPKTSLQRVQDAVHGLMEFRGMEGIVIELLSTRELQRLRRIRQLGLAHLVYPAAEHSRFSHCLGAAYLAIQFGKQLHDETRDIWLSELVPSEYEIRDLATAALCHDLGHGPLSHAWEREIVGGEDYDFDAWFKAFGFDSGQRASLRGLKWHELVTQALLAWPDGELNQLLTLREENLVERIRRMLRGDYWLKYLPRLLSSDIDVDRGDFLLRDAHNCGVAYGKYDVKWLISTCTLGVNENERPVVGFDRRKAVRVVEQFLNSRRAMYDTVYTHRTIRCAEGMVGLFLRRLKDLAQTSGAPVVGEVFRPLMAQASGQAVSQTEILALDDHTVWALIGFLAGAPRMDETLRDIGGRLLTRDLFKRVSCDGQRALQFLAKPNGRDRVYDALRKYCRGDPKYYLVEEHVEFRMLAEKEPERAYLVDPDDSGRCAIPVRDPEVAVFGSNAGRSEFRLYTIADAVDAVGKLIRGPA
jgi:uncharacterized protein